MKASKRKKLEAAGWKVGAAREFLGLSDEEAAFVELCWWRYLREGVERCKLSPMEATYLEPEIVTRKGKPVSVILPIKDYEELLERVEDAEDVASLKQARRKKLQYRPLEDYLAKTQRQIGGRSL